jgi:phosphoglycerol transferase
MMPMPLSPHRSHAAPQANSLDDSCSLRSFLKASAIYVLAALLTLGILSRVIRLGQADLTVPLLYQGDSLLTGMWIKSIIDHGWFLHNDAVGAPYGLDMQDYPVPDGFHFGMIKLLALVLPDASTIQNVYFLLTFPLTTLTSLFVFRRFQLAYPPALAGSLLYTFLYYHFARGLGHLFLAAYYLVPLMVLVALWVYRGEVLPLRDRAGRRPFQCWNFPTLASLVICVLMSGGGIYYAFFGCFFLLVAGTAAWLRQKRFRTLCPALGLAGVTMVGILANFAPTFLYRLHHGINGIAIDRSTGEAERYGLKIAQLLLPHTGHPLPWAAKIKNDYNVGGPAFVNENETASLGVIGSVGFLLLLGGLLFRRTLPGLPLFEPLSLFTGAGLLLGTMGGFGALVAVLGCKWLRGYNRISVYIAFFALFLVALLLDAWYRKRVHSRMTAVLYGGFLALLVSGGVFDQTIRYSHEIYAVFKQEFQSDADFVRSMETRLPAGAMVFQLPYMTFPETTPPKHMVDYDPFRAYFHSKTLKWSYGAMKGREGDEWQKGVAARPVDDMVRTLVCAGFRGLYIDRHGYDDRAAALENNLTRLLGAPPLVSRNQRLVFFDLTSFADQLRRQLTPREWEVKQDVALYPLFFFWRKFGPETVEGDQKFRWCGPKGQLQILNRSVYPRKVEIRALVRTARGGPGTLRISGPLVADPLTVDAQAGEWTTTLIVPPGKHEIQLACDAQESNPAAAAGNLVFRVVNFRAQEGGPVFP